MKAPKNIEYWVAQRLHEEPNERAIGILNQWVHSTRKTEATEETVALLNDLLDKDVLRALRELKQLRHHIRRMSGHQPGNGMGFRNPCGSWVRVHAGTGTGRDSPTHEL